MELVDKELEDQLVDIGGKLSSPPSDVQQLLLLLDKTENFLSKVEQSPSQSMFTAIQPAMKALVARDILCHSDVDVKAAVASCLSEITRITAPEAPYDDKLMKEIFGLIVEAFKKLDKMSCRSFPKRVSILETVAKVRSCVLMLDLECDDLILEMFHHFFKTIRSNHPEKVFSSMETIMTLVIEENEIITRSLLLCLLDYLRNDQKNIMPITKKLAEKVVINCSSKLKPYLDDFFSGCHSINDYSKIVASVCRGKLDMLLPNQMNFADQTQADDGRLSERAISDELPQEHDTLPEKAVAAVEKPCKSVMNNGTCHLENEVSVASEEKPKLSLQDGQSRNTSGAILPASIVETVAVKRNKRKDLNSRKRRGRKAFLRMPVSNDHNVIGSRKVSFAVTARRKGHGKESNFSRVDGPSFEEVESAEHPKDDKKNVAELSEVFADAVVSVPLHSPSEHDQVSPKKGRPPRAKSSGKGKAFDRDAVGDLSSASQPKGLSGRSRIVSSDLPTKDLKSKDLDAHGVSKEKAHQGRRGYRKKVRGVEFLGQLQSDGTEKEIEGRKPADDNERGSNLKELVSSPKSTMIDTANDQSHDRSTTETKSRQKRARSTQEIFGATKRRKSLNEKLVGSKIKVWWPDDKRFYDGFVDSFDRSTKKHTIVYTDGDIEVLLLKKERWEFIEGESMMAGEENIQDINSSETSKKEEGSTDAVPDKTIVKSPRGRKPVDWTRKNSSRSKGRSASRHLNWNITDDSHLNEAVNTSEEVIPQAVGRRKHPRSEFGDNADDSIPKSRKSRSKRSKKSMNGPSKPKELEKSKDDSSPGNESKQSKSVLHRPREHKKSNDSSLANGNSKKSKRTSSRPKESKKSNADSSRADKRPRKRPGDAHVPVIESKRGPRKIKSVKHLQKPGRVTVAQLSKKRRTSNNPQSKRGEAEVRTTSVKKRKRERLAK